MLKRNLFVGLAFLTAAVVSGCKGDDDDDAVTPRNNIEVSGTRAEVAQGGKKVVVFWSVSSGSPDYAYVFGEGTATGGSFALPLGERPPPEAVNSYGVAIGMLGELREGVSVPTGKLDTSFDDEKDMVSASTRHAIIWRDPGNEGLPWSGTFSPGYSCGSCVDAPEGETFDSYVPVDCSEVRLVPSSDYESSGGFCNWT
jgi:hypothetical protein